MIKVLSESEEHRGYTESYEVKFWYRKPDGYLAKKSVFYYVKNSRRAHKNVEARWKKDFKNCILISVIYQ